MTIPIITRTNTIDEWRIQTNLSAIDLNNLKANNYTKSNGTLELANSSALLISANGTALQVSNSAFIGKDLTVTNNVSIGTIGAAIGNVSIGNSVIIGGPGLAVNVSNSVYVGKHANVVGNVYANNASINTSVYVAGTANVAGIVTLSGSGKVLEANTGTVYVNNAFLTTATLQQANVGLIYALEAKIDNLSDIASAVIGILRVTTGNVYYLASNTLYANTGTIRDFVANSTGNVVTLTSNVATINTATIGNLNATNGTIIDGNVVTLTSNNATLNTSTLVNTTVTNAAIANAVISSAAITTGQITNGTITNGTVINGNVVTLTSNNATLNTSTLLSSNVVSLNLVNGNVSGNLDFTNGASLRLNSGVANDAIVVESGISSLQSLVVEGNLTVAGIFTQTGNINFETDRFIFNANTTDNKDALIINRRVAGSNSQIIWNETNDRWEISTGNTWITTYKILDGADIYTGVDSDSTTRVASASAVKFAYQAGGVIAGGYANAAYAVANSAFNGTEGTHVNSAFSFANTSSQRAITSGSYANSAFAAANTADQKAVTSGSYANSAFAAANTAVVAGGQIAGGYANSAFKVANSALFLANVAFDGEAGTPPAGWGDDGAGNPLPGNPATQILLPDGRPHRGSHAWHAYRHANSAHNKAVTALADAATADAKAVTADAKAVTADGKAVTADTKATAACTAITSINSSLSGKYDKTGGTISGDAVITGTLRVAGVGGAPGVTIASNEFKVADGIITLNSDALQGQFPSENAGIEVQRGGNVPSQAAGFANVYVRWTESAGKWQFTNNGQDYLDLVGVTPGQPSTLSSYLPLAGGTVTGAVTFQGTTVVPEPRLTAAGASDAVTRSYVDQRVSTASALPSTSGQIPSPAGENNYNQFVFLTVNSAGAAEWKRFNRADPDIYEIDVRTAATCTGRAATAGSADTAGQATTALGLSVPGISITSSGYSQTGGTFSFNGSGAASFYQGLNLHGSAISAGTFNGGTFNGTFNGDLNGTATRARYADLAEMYLADGEYDEGTLMAIGGNKEITAATIANFRVLGVVSSHPAHLMNADLKDGTIVALKGRVPVKVIGKVTKGEPLGASVVKGYAQVSINNYFGLSLENKDTDGEGVVEAVIL